MLPPPSLAAGRDVSNDDEVLVSTYNVIVPHKESNVNAWFGAQVVAALPMFSALMTRPRNAPGTFRCAAPSLQAVCPANSYII
jgi:hypothetical protein